MCPEPQLSKTNVLQRSNWLAAFSVSCVVLGAVSILLFIYDIEIFFLFACILFPMGFVSGVWTICIACRQRQSAAVVVAAIALALAVPFTLLELLMLTAARRRGAIDKAQSVTQNMRLVGKSLQRYAEDNGRLPEANNWMNALLNYDKRITIDNFKNPRLDGVWIVFNKYLGALKLSEVPPGSVLLFEGPKDCNSAGGEDLLKRAAEQRGDVYVLLTDQHLGIYCAQACGVKAVDGAYVPPRFKP